MVLGVYLANGINDNTLLVNHVSGTQRSLRHFAVHFLFAPRLVCLKNRKIGISNEVERQIVLGDETLMRSGAVATHAQDIVSQRDEAFIVIPQIASLSRAARRAVLRVKIEHKLLAGKISQLYQITIFVNALKIRGFCTFLQHSVKNLESEITHFSENHNPFELKLVSLQAEENTMNNRLYSIGHSNQSQEEFLGMLSAFDINCVVDVRTVPASKYSPQFNQEPLRMFLNRNGIEYLHFGEEFGARRSDCLDDNGMVNFEAAVETPNFKHGVTRIIHGLEQDYRIAFMCSEAEPLECHRFALVSRYFHDNGIDVQHIRKGSVLVSHSDLEKEMIQEYLHSKKYHLSEVDNMFGSYTEEEQRIDAYRLKNKEIGYTVQPVEIA